MQDLSKMTDLNIRSLKQDKWLNKDRIWTFVFWFGMAGGLSIASFAKFIFEVPELFPIIAWTTLFSIPLMVTLANKTRFIKKDTFANSEGKLITEKQMPYSFPLAIIAGCGFTFMVVETILPKHQDGNFFLSFIFFGCLFSGLSLYFIFKNCPISILFNRKFWTFEFYHRQQKGSTSNYYSRARNNSIFASRPENIYIDHKRR